MKFLRRMLFHVSLPFIGLCALLLIVGCDDPGAITETSQGNDERDLSAIPGPVDPAQLEPVDRVSRTQFGTANTPAALAYPGLSAGERDEFEAGLDFFIVPHTPEEGVGPVANQNRCLGCHTNSEQAFPGLVTTNTPASRAFRSAPTDFERSSAGNAPTETAAFTLFGNFSPSTGSFNGLAEFGGPVQHVRPPLPGCEPDVVLPVEVDPFLRGGTTGLRRTVGERVAPPYVGRGLIETVPAEVIVAFDDPSDTAGHNSSLASAAATTSGCVSDCISGRHNENPPPASLVGGDPVVRVGRLGLRAAGPTLIQFMIGGSNGEIGFTSPFAPNDPIDPQNVGRGCDVAPDPELDAQTILELRTAIRLISLPELDPCLLGTSEDCLLGGATRASIERGAQLFGVDLEAFRSRMLPGSTPVGDANGINQADRQLNCAGCHIPIITTGESRASVGAGHLSHKWVPMWSDLVLHDMGEVSTERAAPELRAPFLRQDGVFAGTFDLSRNLSDDALPGQGNASGREWRTPPLMGIGRIGPPFLHDGRVFLSTTSSNFASTVYTSADAGPNAPLIVDSIENAFLAVIELHDLPQPDDAPVDGGNCPVPPGGSVGEICPPLASANRSEARNVIQRWRALSDDDQQAVVNFLRSL